MHASDARGPWRLLARLALLGALVGSVYLGTLVFIVFRVPFRPDYAYMAVALGKDRRLHETPSPKIILVGGSNLAFGVNSRLLGRETGMPVVNLGLHADLGLDFMLEWAFTNLQSQDVLVVSLEHMVFFKNETAPQVPFVLHVSPKHWKRIRRLQQFVDLLRHGPILVRSAVAYRVNKPHGPYFAYSPACFSLEGDCTCHLARPSRRVISRGTDPWASGDLSGFMFDWGKVRLLRHFISLAHARGARVLLSPPPLARSEFQRDRARIDTTWNALSALPVARLSRPEDYVFPDSRFWDTVFHLDRMARRDRTFLLAQEIEKAGMSRRLARESTRSELH